MSSLGSPNPFFIAGKKAYEVERSLRFNRGDDAYLQATLGNSNLNKWTLSIWVKKAVNGEHQAILSSGDSSVSTMVNFGNSDRLKFTNYPGSSAGIYITTRKFRDPSAWYHIVAIWDSGNSTAGDRIRLYVNGVRETAFDQSDNPNQNQNSVINGNTQGGSTWGNGKHRIGRYSNYADNSGCYYAEVNFVDGQAYDPSYFGATDVITGQWIPKKYVGSYGTNGFYLNFSDNSGTTATTLGKDSSGNGNNFTPNNFSVAANLTNDSMPDTPTNNFCTLNPLNATSSFNFGAGEGNLVFDQSSNDQAITGTFFVTSGKWYWEIYKNASQNPEIGICGQETLSNQSTGTVNSRLAFITNNGNLRTGSSSTTTITGSSSGQTGAGYIRIAVDMDNKKIWFSDTSGNYFNSGNPATGANAAYDFSSHPVKDGWTPYVFMGTGSGHNCYMNFGQFELNSFSSNIPAGFKTLCSANLPDPTILLPNKHFETLTYTGDSNTSRNITGLQFQPDWVWIKRRSASANHRALDSVRGSTKELYPNLTNAESTFTGISSFNSNGFTLATADPNYNLNTATYVAWNWNGGDTDGKTYTVKVVSDSGNKYRFDDFGTSAVTLDLAEGGTYIFDQSDSSNAGHPLRFSTTSNGTHGGGSEYTTGVTTAGTPGQSGAYTQIIVAASAPTLYYYCTNHSGMGGQANTNSTLGSSNFDGSIQSTVKVNASAGFSIVSYAGNQSSAYTIGHGLGVAPNIIFTKSRTDAVNWGVYYDILGTNTNYLVLNTSDAQGANNNSEMSGVFAVLNSSTVQMSYTAFGDAGSSVIMYAFSEVAGYSKFGSYTGNGSTDGTFVFTGFRPALVIFKRSSASNSWYMMDNKRNTFNLTNTFLRPDTSAAESNAVNSTADFLSNGFKFRGNGNDVNASGSTYIYLAFAESPFKNARAR